MTVRILVRLAIVAGIAGCASTPTEQPATPASLAIVTEPAPNAESGVVLGTQPVIELRDARGAPVSTRGVLVTAEIATGGGTLAGTTGVRTDANGRASYTDLAITGAVGPRSLRFSAADLAAVTSASISLVAGAPAVLTPSAGDKQTAPAGTPLPVAPAVLVSDGSGNPVPDIAVTFAVTAGGGTVEGGSATSGADGIARSTKWTLGAKIGANSLTATAGAVHFTFAATGTVGAPAKIALVGGDHQSAVIGNPVPVAPSVKVTDQFDNPVSGIAITFQPSAGGSVTGATQSDDQGTATVAAWTLGLVAGAQTLVASRAGIVGVTFTATAVDFSVQAIAAGTITSCGVSPNGAAYCWGDNSAGQLGTGTQTASGTPAAVAGGHAYSQIAVGAGHVCGLATTGDVYCWGLNSIGQLGDSTLFDSPTPSLVAGNHRFKAIATGDVHSCALDLGGAAWCWGSNGNGRLGTAAPFSALAPTPVAGGHVFTAITAGAAHTCGIRSDGQLLCWGSNNGGRLGDGSGVDQPTPVLVTLTGASFAAAAAGGTHTCAVTTTGSGYCWGIGSNGQIGNGGTTNQATPALLSGSDSWTAIATGQVHSCGITTGGLVKCWGANGSGRLGDGTLVQRLVPTAVLGTFTASRIEPGVDQTCAMTTTGSALCWGADGSGQLGDGGTAPALRPIGVHRP